MLLSLCLQDHRKCTLGHHNSRVDQEYGGAFLFPETANATVDPVGSRRSWDRHSRYSLTKGHWSRRFGWGWSMTGRKEQHCFSTSILRKSVRKFFLRLNRRFVHSGERRHFPFWHVDSDILGSRKLSVALGLDRHVEELAGTAAIAHWVAVDVLTVATA